MFGSISHRCQAPATTFSHISQKTTNNEKRERRWTMTHSITIQHILDTLPDTKNRVDQIQTIPMTNETKKKRKKSIDLLFVKEEEESSAQIPSKKKTKNENQVDGASLQRKKSELARLRKELPVYQFQSHIIQAMAKNDVLLIVAETGSGKSTQIPAYLDEHLGKFYRNKATHTARSNKHQMPLARSICVTQPRRVAAMTVAKRVAEERGCRLGTAVGYKVRFDDATTPQTRIIYATDGMLLRESMADPLLSRYSVVVLDESHERSLQTDILFGVVQRAMRARNSRDRGPEDVNDENETVDQRIQRNMRRRAEGLFLPPLKAVVMSATLEVETFATFFPRAETIRIPGRMYPVQIVYTKEPQDDYLDSALATALQIHQDAEEGDVLVFLPGQEEITDLAALIKRNLEQDKTLTNALLSNSSAQEGTDIFQSLKGMGANISTQAGTIVNGVMICVLYAALPPEAQMMAFAPKPPGCIRKIILSTNIAETSVTLDGVRYVVDCGKHKTRDFNGTTGMESLMVEDISQAQAAQRTGRAGRTSAGVCFRLYTEDAFTTLEEASTPEILRVNLAQVVLMLKGMGVHNPADFDYLTKPSQQSLKKACELLYALDALDEKLELTDYGKKMAKLPVDPIYAHLLLQSSKYKCADEMLTAVSMLSAENVMYRPGGSGGEETNGGGLAAKAALAHRRFSSHEGDIPTLLAVYRAWRKEAVYLASGGKKAQQQVLKSKKGLSLLLHGDWCAQNFISGRALVRAHDVRRQLRTICGRPMEKHGLGMDITSTCGEDMETFLKCVCAGLFLQSAARLPNVKEIKGRGSGSVVSTRGRYKTKVGNSEVSIHPTSTLFGRNPAPKCVVYTELLVTKKTYIRGVTQVREEWLAEVAPKFFNQTK